MCKILEWNSQRSHGHECQKAYQVLWFDSWGHSSCDKVVRATCQLTFAGKVYAVYTSCGSSLS